MRVLQHHFSQPLNYSNIPPNVVYELSTLNVINGPGISLDLSQEVHVDENRPSSLKFKVTLNGKVKRGTTSDVVTLRGKGYTVVLDARSLKMIAVYGRGLHLRPLHATRYSNLLVNIKAFSTRVVHLTDDYVIPPASDIARESDNTDVASDDENPPEQDEVEDTSRITLNKVSLRQTGTCASGTTHIVELAVAYDNTFCADFGNMETAATQALQDTVTEANVAYGANTCIQLEITTVEAHCNDPNDPYATFSDFSTLPCTQAEIDNGEPCSPSELILDRFTTFWRDNRNSVPRDAAIFFSGFDDGTGVVGIAFLRAACLNRFGYGWIEGSDAFVTAHEIGHILGGRHTPSGIMSATLRPNTAFSFSSVSVGQFTNYIDNIPSSSCITPAEVQEPTPSSSPVATPSSSPVPNPSSSPVPTPSSSPVPTPSSSLVPTPSSSLVPTPSSSPVPTPSSSPVPTPSADASTAPGTCGSAFSRTRALKCRRRRVGRFTLEGDNGRRIGRLIARLEQRSGEFRLVLSGSRGISLRNVRARVSTISGGTLGALQVLSPNTRSVTVGVVANDQPIPSGATSCCGQSVFASYEVTACRTSGRGEVCVTITESVSVNITCRNVCRRLPPSAIFVPMSNTNDCPSCGIGGF